MKKKPISKVSTDADIEKLRKRSKTDMKRLAKMSDDEIDYSDIPPLTKDWFDEALLVPAITETGSRNWHKRVEEAMAKNAKKPISLRMDPDVYSWFRAQGPRYQSRMNAVLRAYMETHRS
jgi:uncharacterized protein (DUF4415 family)